MLSIGMSLNVSNQREEMFAACRDAGIDCVEISCSYYDEAQKINFRKVKEWSEKYNIDLWSFHLPFGHFNTIDISSTDEKLRRNSVRIMSDYISRAAAIGIDKFIIHPSGEPIDEKDRKARMSASKRSLKELAATAAKHGGVLCVEDLPRTCLGRDSNDIKELISADDRLRVCFDTNHLLKEENEDFIREIGEKIITMHVSDYDRVNERHWLPGEGVVDWFSLLETLEEVGYKGPWLYEISLKCPDSIKRPRDLECADFVRNADEIFGGNDITVIAER